MHVNEKLNTLYYVVVTANMSIEKCFVIRFFWIHFQLEACDWSVYNQELAMCRMI